MKKALSLILALVMALSLSVTALAADNSTDVTAEVEMTYEMVIPADGAVMTETNHASGVLLGTEGHTEAKIDNVKHEDTTKKVYYTATLGNFSDGKGNTMEASYTYSQGSTSDAVLTSNSTKVYVYDGTKAAGSRLALSTIKVSVGNTAWDAAPIGTYTATVTFNFAEEEVAELPATMKISEILATVDDFPVKEDEIPAGAWKSGENSCFKEDTKLVFRLALDGASTNIKIFDHETAIEAQLTEGNYVYTNDTKTCTFVMQNGKLTAITFSRSDNPSYDGTYTAPTT